MAVTYTATPGVYRSALRNVLVSHAAAQSEVVTLVHGLGVCPTEVRVALRSIAVSPSGMLLPPTILALNASQASLVFGAAAQAMAESAYVDVICENTYSKVQ